MHEDSFRLRVEPARKLMHPKREIYGLLEQPALRGPCPQPEGRHPSLQQIGRQIGLLSHESL